MTTYRRTWVILPSVLAASILLFLTVPLITEKYRWRNFWSKEQIDAFVTRINSADSCPPTFYHVYDSIYPFQRHSTMFKMQLEKYRQAILGHIDVKTAIKYRDCSCAEVEPLLNSGRHVENAGEILGYALVAETTPERCFDFFAHNFEMVVGDMKIRGIEELSDYLFKRNVNALTPTECVLLVSLIRNGS